MLDAARIRYLIDGALNVIAETAKHGGPAATEEQIAERIAICTDCDQIQNENCGACGCKCNGRLAWRNKLAWKSSSCPHPDGPRWTAITD